MKKRHKIMTALSMAACAAVMIAAALAVGGTIRPQPDEVATPALDAGKTYAPGDAIVYFTEQGNYYHDVPDCSGMTGAREGAEGEAIALGKRPCPVCLSGWPVNGWDEGSEAPVEAEDADGEPQVFYTKGGRYYHYDAHCSDMQGAARHSVSEARADGRLPCPVCVADEAKADDGAPQTGLDRGGAVSAEGDTGGAVPPLEHMTPDPTSAPTPEAAAEEGGAPTSEITPEPTPTPEITPEPTPTPEITPEPTPTPEITPEPTPTPQT